jgi:dTMP kinase
LTLPHKSLMFISFEGPEGSGKTLQISALAEFLKEAGYPVLATREPGGTGIGDQVREILLDLDNIAMQARTEILLFQASRAQLVEEVILPHLAKGDIVLSDRYADSTIAYQGYGHQVNLEQLKNIVTFATGGLKPGLSLLLDIDVEDGLRRKSGGEEWNRLDAYELDFHERVRQGFHQMVAAEPERWVVIDAAKTRSEVQAEIRQIVLERLSEKGVE